VSLVAVALFTDNVIAAVLSGSQVPQKNVEGSLPFTLMDCGADPRSGPEPYFVLAVRLPWSRARSPPLHAQLQLPVIVERV
jgi:hypothetical protein